MSVSDDPMPLTMSVPEAGRKYFDVSENVSYRLAAEGKIPFIRAGRKKRVPIAAMEKLLASVTPAAAA